jgi:hypothetical protein
MYIKSINGKISESGTVSIFEPIFHQPSHNFSLPIEGTSVQINLTINDLKNIYAKNPTLIDNMKKSFDGLNVEIDNKNYTLDEIINELTDNQTNKVASIKRLIEKSI